jgi:hypothetical protein
MTVFDVQVQWMWVQNIRVENQCALGSANRNIIILVEPKLDNPKHNKSKNVQPKHNKNVWAQKDYRTVTYGSKHGKLS